MKNKKYILLPISWWICALIQFAVIYYYRLSIIESWNDAAIASALIVGAGYVMISIARYIRPSIKKTFIIIISAFVLALLASGVHLLIIKELPFSQSYVAWLHHTLPLRIVFVWLIVMIIAISSWLFFYVKEHQQNELREKEFDKLAREAELSNLRQQLQPHFLFNSLNSISALTIVQPEQARKMIEQLSDFLRGTVKNPDSHRDGNQFVSLQDELHHLQLYLDIEKVRFGHRLVTNVTANDAALEMKLPSLLLQPILENAIKFGLYDTIGEVIISIDAKADKNFLLIEIKNPFDPETATPKIGTGFGLSSVKRRLALVFYRNDLLTTNQNENVFTTSIKIPQA